jgi:cysteine desulfurase
MRAGTENVILDVALGQACEIARRWIEDPTMHDLTDYLWSELKNRLGNKVVLNGHFDLRLPNTLNISFLGWNGHEILGRLPDIAASTGSACHSGETSISPVLQAMGVSADRGRGAVRFSLGRYTQRKEINQVISQVEQIIKGV